MCSSTKSRINCGVTCMKWVLPIHKTMTFRNGRLFVFLLLIKVKCLESSRMFFSFRRKIASSVNQNVAQKCHHYQQFSSTETEKCMNGNGPKCISISCENLKSSACKIPNKIPIHHKFLSKKKIIDQFEWYARFWCSHL